MNHETVQNVTSKKREGKREEIAHDEMRSRPSGSITLFFPFLFPISNTDLRLTHTIQKRTAGQSPLPIPRSYLFLFNRPPFSSPQIPSNFLTLHSPKGMPRSKSISGSMAPYYDTPASPSHSNAPSSSASQSTKTLKKSSSFADLAKRQLKKLKSRGDFDFGCQGDGSSQDISEEQEEEELEVRANVSPSHTLALSG